MYPFCSAWKLEEALTLGLPLPGPVSGREKLTGKLTFPMNDCCRPSQEAERLEPVTVALGQLNNMVPGQAQSLGLLSPESAVISTGRWVSSTSRVRRFRIVLPASSQLATHCHRAAGQGPSALGRAVVLGPDTPSLLLPGVCVCGEAKQHSSLSCESVSSNSLPPGTPHAASGTLPRPPYYLCAEPAPATKDLPSAVPIRSFILPLTRQLLSSSVWGKQMEGQELQEQFIRDNISLGPVSRSIPSGRWLAFSALSSFSGQSWLVPD